MNSDRVKYGYNDSRNYFKYLIGKNTDCIPGAKDLSKKQLEVVILKLAGFKNIEIAKLLDIAEKTVKFHYGWACEKMSIACWQKVNQKLLNKDGATTRLQVFINLFHYNHLNKYKQSADY